MIFFMVSFLVFLNIMVCKYYLRFIISAICGGVKCGFDAKCGVLVENLVFVVKSEYARVAGSRDGAEGA